MLGNMEMETANGRAKRKEGYRLWLDLDEHVVWAKRQPDKSIAEIMEDGIWRDIKALRCTRCNGEWRQRGESPPERCPKCNSPYWSRPRIR